ncbi:MAG TPA: tetratricopeptide repeat protein [Streptosporangiaceae bacterium]|nr:tetratricopeptide repeat protein [Streptosporangiaceae bacterium]
MLGEWVRAHRRRLGWTQEELAEATGLSVRAIGKLEAGVIAAPRPATVRLLADAFGLSGDDRERFCRAAAGEVSVEADQVPAQLPTDIPGFTAREAELRRLDATLGAAAGRAAESGSAQAGAAGPRIAVVSGTAGVGKTALAVHWAHGAADLFPDGQLYVNLRGFDPSGQVVDPSVAVRGFLHALGVPPPRIPADPDAQVALYRSLISGKRMLVVADNARDEQQVRPLLPGTPAVAVLATSRSRLTGLVAVEGACPIALDQLCAIEARDLLARRLGGDRTGAEPQAVDQIIAACARLPLALAIAASRAQQTSFPLATLAAELDAADQRLDALDTGEPTSQVRTVISWSHATLSPPAARLFRLLGLHPGPDTTTAAAANLADLEPPATRRLFGELARANLLNEHSPGRYTFHDLLRAYASEQAHDHETEQERRGALSRLLDYYLAGAGAAMDALFPAEKYRRPAVPVPSRPVSRMPTATAARDWLDAEWPTLVAVTTHARDHAQPGHAILLALTLYRYLDTSGRYPEARTVCGAALDAARETGDLAAQAEMLRRLGYFDTGQPPHRLAADEFRSALRLYQEIGDRVGQGLTQMELGCAEFAQGRVQESSTSIRQALAIFREAGDQHHEAGALSNLGIVAVRQGDPEQAADHQRKALAIFRELGDGVGQAIALHSLGEALGRLGHYRQAEDHLGHGLAIFRELGWRSGEADAMQKLGHVFREQGRYEQAIALHRRALTIFRDTGERFYEAEALNSLGESLSGGGDPGQARARHQEALALARQIGACYELARAHHGLARTYEATGDRDLARSHGQDALTGYTSLGVPDAADVRARLNDLGA